MRASIFTVPAKLVVHQSRLTLRASLDQERTREIVEGRQRLLALRQSLAA